MRHLRLITQILTKISKLLGELIREVFFGECIFAKKDNVVIALTEELDILLRQLSNPNFEDIELQESLFLHAASRNHQ
jgi:hypothetical protein